MKNALLIVALSVLMGCSSPNDIVLGPEPLKQMAEQGDKFKKMSQEDRTLLASYLTVQEMGKLFGGADKAGATTVVGRTVGEVMVDARAWKEKLKAQEAESKKREAEVTALKAKVEAERKLMAEKIAGMVTVAVVDKKVLPKNYQANRFEELLIFMYAVENKSAKNISQLKGTLEFFDPTGDKIGDLPLEITTKIPSGQTVKTDTGRGFKMNPFTRGDIEKIAGMEYSVMKAKFSAESIAFEDGDVIKAPN